MAASSEVDQVALVRRALPRPRRRRRRSRPADPRRARPGPAGRRRARRSEVRHVDLRNGVAARSRTVLPARARAHRTRRGRSPAVPGRARTNPWSRRCLPRSSWRRETGAASRWRVAIGGAPAPTRELRQVPGRGPTSGMPSHRPLSFERGNSDAHDARHRPVKNHVLAVDLLGKDDAVLVVAGDARPVAPIALRGEQVVGRDQAHARSGGRVSRVGDRVAPLLGQVGDAGILDAPFLVRRIARDSGAVPDFIDVPPSDEVASARHDRRVSSSNTRTSSTTRPLA